MPGCLGKGVRPRRFARPRFLCDRTGLRGAERALELLLGTLSLNPLPNLRQLRYLVALSDHLHFGDAAEACQVTQSTLSSGIQELEALLGVPVAERTKRSVVLTPVGRRIVERARFILKDVDELMEIGARASRPLSGRLELGVIPTIGPFLLPKLVPHIIGHYPDMRLILREDKTEELLERLHAGRLDLLLIAFPYEAEGCETFMLANDSYRLACHPDDRLAHLESISAEDVRGVPLMLLEKDHCLHSHALPFLKALPAQGVTTFQGTSLYTLIAMVAEGLGTTLVPELAIESGSLSGSNVVTVPLSDPQAARQLGLCWRKNSSRAAEFRELGAVIRDWAESQLPHARLAAND